MIEDKVLRKRIEAHKKGRLHYALTKGSIFGVLMFMATNLFQIQEHSMSELFLSSRGILNLAIFLVVGILWYGTLIWWINEKIINKISNKNNKNEK